MCVLGRREYSWAACYQCAVRQGVMFGAIVVILSIAVATVVRMFLCAIIGVRVIVVATCVVWCRCRVREGR